MTKNTSFCSDIALSKHDFESGGILSHSHRPWKESLYQKMSNHKNAQKNWGKSVLKVILLQLRHYYIFGVPYVTGIYTGTLIKVFEVELKGIALDQANYVDPHGVLWAQWFNHTVEPGLDI